MDPRVTRAFTSGERFSSPLGYSLLILAWPMMRPYCNHCHA